MLGAVHGRYVCGRLQSGDVLSLQYMLMDIHYRHPTLSDQACSTNMSMEHLPTKGSA